MVKNIFGLLLSRENLDVRYITVQGWWLSQDPTPNPLTLSFISPHLALILTFICYLTLKWPSLLFVEVAIVKCLPHKWLNEDGKELLRGNRAHYQQMLCDYDEWWSRWHYGTEREHCSPQWTVTYDSNEQQCKNVSRTSALENCYAVVDWGCFTKGKLIISSP